MASSVPTEFLKKNATKLFDQVHLLSVPQIGLSQCGCLSPVVIDLYLSSKRIKTIGGVGGGVQNHISLS